MHVLSLPKTLGRKIKRRLFSKGYAPPVYDFLCQIPEQPMIQEFGPKQGEYVVNVSFDLEYSLSTYFWQHNFIKASHVGDIALTQLTPTMECLKLSGVPSNVQVVGMLLDPKMIESTLFSEEQKIFIQKHPEYFSLHKEHISILTDEDIELGIHGYSHRLFPDLSHEEADFEVSLARRLLNQTFTKNLAEPCFMSFPRNNVAHVAVLKTNGVYAYRSNEQSMVDSFEIPRGLWFSASHLDYNTLSRILTNIKAHKESYLLHFWGHFTEMDTETLKGLIDAVHKSGWKFTSIHDFRRQNI